MIKFHPLTVAVALATAGAGCAGETTIVLRADKQQITAGGIDFATVTAQALLNGDPVGSGVPINFSTDQGSFAPSQDLYSTSVTTNGSGEAKVKLYSSDKPGQATISADFTDEESGLTGTGSLTIRFGPPTLDKLPVGGTFRLSCEAVNIGALRTPIPDLNVTCELTALTRDGVAIPASALQPKFLTEAGSFTPKDDAQSGERIFVYSPKGGASIPQDVQPDPALAEPSYADANGKVRNPRDGLVTLVAVIDGEEGFTDTNGNGVYDQGEPFEDAAEPFVDVDDNDRWDVGEQFIDTNANGQWDAANGVWDPQAKISAIYKILWTGPVHDSPKTSRIERLTNIIPEGGKLELSAYILDANLNPLAGFQANQDTVEWTLVSGGDAVSNDPTLPPFNNVLGFEFDRAANTERKRWTIVSNSFAATPFTFTVEDGYPNDGTLTPTSFTVSVRINVSPGPSGDGYFLPQVNEAVADRVQGTCN